MDIPASVVVALGEALRGAEELRGGAVPVRNHDSTVSEKSVVVIEASCRSDQSSLTSGNNVPAAAGNRGPYSRPGTVAAELQTASIRTKQGGRPSPSFLPALSLEA